MHREEIGSLISERLRIQPDLSCPISSGCVHIDVKYTEKYVIACAVDYLSELAALSGL